MRGNVVFRIRGKGLGVCFSAFSQGGARDKLAMVLLEGGAAHDPARIRGSYLNKNAGCPAGAGWMGKLSVM